MRDRGAVFGDTGADVFVGRRGGPGGVGGGGATATAPGLQGCGSCCGNGTNGGGPMLVPSSLVTGGAGAAGGSTAALQSYFAKVEPVIHREWKPPQTVVSSSREVEAHVRLRVAADGTVESLKLVKPTGNVEVDKSIEDALQRVKKLDRPPAELLKNGVLEASVEFVLEV